MSFQDLLNALKLDNTKQEEPLMSEMAPIDYEKMQSLPTVPVAAPVQEIIQPKVSSKLANKNENIGESGIQEATNAMNDWINRPKQEDQGDKQPQITPMSKSEALLAEYKKMADSHNEDLVNARNRDRMLKVGGAIGDALATYLNAQGQMKVKAPGVQIQQGAGLGKVADMFATAPEIASDLAQKREALMNQYKQMSIAEMAKAKRDIESNKLDIMKEKNRLYGQQVEKMGAGREEAKQFKENKFEYDKIVKLQESFNKDKQVTKAEERIQSASTLRDMIDGNPITQEAAKTFAARASGEVGALSDQDRAAYGGSKALIDRINSTFTRAVTGELTDMDKKFMRELADKFEQAGQRDLQARLNVYAKQGTKRTKMSEDEVKETIRPDLALQKQDQQATDKPQTIIRFDPKSQRKVEYDATTKKPIRFVD